MKDWNSCDFGVLDMLHDVLGYEFVIEDGRVTGVVQG